MSPETRRGMFHVKHADGGYGRLLEGLGIAIPQDRIHLLATYERLLRDRALPSGMIAKGDAARIEGRHVMDSIRAAPLLPSHGTIVDIGSGAGLPGFPLAIAAPSVSVVLVEARRRRAAFLELAQAELALSNIDVMLGDVAAAPRAAFDVVVARAYGDAVTTWHAAEGLLRDGGYLLYWAGAGFMAARDAPPGVDVRTVTSPVAGVGPIAIMARQ